MPAPAIRPSAVSPGTVPTLSPASYVTCSSKSITAPSDAFVYTITGAVAGDILIIAIPAGTTATTPTVTLTSGAMTLLSTDTWQSLGGGSSAYKTWVFWKDLAAGDLATPGVTNTATVAMTTADNALAVASIWTGATNVTLQQFSSTSVYPSNSIALRGFTPAAASKKQIAFVMNRVNGGAAQIQVASKGLTFRVNNGPSGVGVGSIYSTSISDNDAAQLKPIPYHFYNCGGVAYSQVAAYFLELT